MPSAVPPVGPSYPSSNSNNQEAINLAKKLITAIEKLEDDIKDNAPIQTITSDYNQIATLSNQLLAIPVSSRMGIAGLDEGIYRMGCQMLGLEIHINGPHSTEINLAENMKSSLKAIIKDLS